MQNLRIKFSKRGLLRFISHLDLNRCIQRAMKRSELPFWSTEGFNPHIYLTFLLPLPVGVESSCDFFDCRMIDEISHKEVITKLGNAFPKGLDIISSASPEKKPAEIAFCGFDIRISGDVRETLDSFFAQDHIWVTKKTKSREREIDLKAEIKSKKVSLCQNGTLLSVLLPQSINGGISPLLLTGEIARKCGLNAGLILRTGVFTESLEEFF